VITLESQPVHIQHQRYRLYDAKGGLLEEGSVSIADMRRHLPWLDENWGDFAFDVTYRAERPAESSPVAAAVT
jgi:hypothetical protein